MTSEEIEKIKEEKAENDKQTIDHTFEDEAIATMAETEGWKIMLRKANKIICDLLEPISPEEAEKVGNLELIGSMAIARGEKIEVLREFVKEVESVKNAKRELLRREQEKQHQNQEESK